MLDDLRNSAEASFLEEETTFEREGLIPRREKRFMGMTAAQRFILAFLVLILVVVLGTLFLLVSGKMVLP
jgi:cell division septal protein FtsQ